MGNVGQLGAWCECLLPGGHSGFLPTPVPPQIAGSREPPAQVSVVRDAEATLECNVTGKPPPRVTWQRDGQPVGAAPGLRLQNQGQSLHVERAQAAHAGRYSCLAENVAGRAERRFALSVLGEDRGGRSGAGRGPRLEKARPSHASFSQEAGLWGGLVGEAFRRLPNQDWLQRALISPHFFPPFLPVPLLCSGHCGNELLSPA